MNQTEINTILKQHHLKRTTKRLVIIDVLMQNTHRLISVDELYRCVKLECKGINLTTIYRNLEVFERIGLVHKSVADNQVNYYKLSCSHHHHHHLICNKCGGIEVLEHCPMKAVTKEAKAHNFKVSGHKFEIYGTCDKCDN